MCGICGHLKPDPRALVEREVVAAMNDSLRHRGPDQGGLHVDRNVALGARRLAIIDRSGGDQPVFNETRTICLVYNGELYNFQELRKELLRLGHRFRSSGDTEVIVHAYEEWGDAAMERFNGMFAFALWDGLKRRLLLARDRTGQKPLYWHYSNQGLLWGSEAKAILKAPWVVPEVDEVALHHYLTLQYVPEPLSMYRGIQKLPAGHKLVIECEGSPKVSRWWRLAFEPKHKLKDREAIEQAQELLNRAVQRRLISEVPLGAFLSGGIDSSIIVALMARHSSRPVKTFSIGFGERHYDESRFARLIAQRYETEHHEFVFRPGDLVGLIESVANATDEPLADPAALPLYELARQARQEVTVALCGDGGDETLAGYSRHAAERVLGLYARLPGWITRRVVPAVTARIPETANVPEDRNLITGIRRLDQFSEVTARASLVRWGSYFSHDEKLDLYANGWRETLSEVDTAEFVGAHYDAAVAANHLDRTLAAEHATYLAGDLLPKTDRVTMAHSLEARAPFLDPEWIEWTARLPTSYKVRGLSTKWLLKNAFTDALAPEITSRGKQGFGVPLGIWMREDLRVWTQSILFETPGLDDWFRPAAVRQLIEEHDSGKSNHAKKLWGLLMFAVWLGQKEKDPSFERL